MRSGTQLVGGNLRLVPYQSAFGCVARLSRLNQARRATEYSQLLGIKPNRHINLLLSLTTSQVQQEALSTTLGIETPPEWDLAAWYPFMTDDPRLPSHLRLRYCLPCIRLGYHTTLHQLPWISTCPWHGVRLRQNCPRCNGFPVTVAGTPTKLLTCACGFDLMNESASALQRQPHPTAAAYLQAYLNWCGEQRRTSRLIVTPGAHIDPSRISSLVDLPPGLALRQARRVCNPKRYRLTTHLDQQSPPAGADTARRASHADLEDDSGPILRHIDQNAAKGSRRDRSDQAFSHQSERVTGARDQPAPDGWSSYAATRPGGRYRMIHPNYLSFVDEILNKFSHFSEQQIDNGKLDPRVRLAVLAQGYAEGIFLSRHEGNLSELVERYRSPSPIALLDTGHPHELRMAFG